MNAPLVETRKLRFYILLNKSAPLLEVEKGFAANLYNHRNVTLLV